MLTLTAAVHRQMIVHALAGLPNEACGLFAGAFGSASVVEFEPMTNTAQSAEIYALDDQEFIAVERRADETGQAILGVMHSHTHTTAYPSPTDVEDAARFDPFGAWFFIIVSLKHPDPAMRAYTILEGEITEHLIELA